MLMSTAIPCAVVFNEIDTTEIQGSLCMTGEQFDTAKILVFIPPLVITIMATVLTYLKVKKSVVDHDTGIIKSVIATNISRYNIF